MLEVEGCPVHAGVNERLNLLTLRAGGDADRRVRGLAYARGTTAANRTTLLRHRAGGTGAPAGPAGGEGSLTGTYATWKVGERIEL